MIKLRMASVIWVLIATALGCSLGGEAAPTSIPAPVASPQQTLTDPVCTGAFITRLKAGGLALVSAGPANILRSGPGVSNPTLTQIPAGTELTVLEGPRCVEHINWWRVNCGACRGYQLGWVAEQRDLSYWLDFKPSPPSTR